MDTLIKVDNFDEIKTKNKSRFKFFFNEILKSKDIPIPLLNDTTIIKILDGIYVKNNIIPCKLITPLSISLNKNSYVTDMILYEKYNKNFISSRKVIEKINNIIEGCESFMSKIECEYINNSLTRIENKIIEHQKTMRRDDKLKYIKTYSHFLLLKETLSIIKNEIYNDFNHVYLETLYFKYNMLTYKNIGDIFNEIFKLEKSYLSIDIPFYIIINNNKHEFSVNNISELLVIIDSNISNYSIKIIQTK